VAENVITAPNGEISPVAVSSSTRRHAMTRIARHATAASLRVLRRRAGAHRGALVVVVLEIALAAFGSQTEAAKTPATGKLCRYVTDAELTAAHISARCINLKTIVTRGVSIPGGRIRQRVFRAAAGHSCFTCSFVQISVDTPLVPHARLPLVRSSLRAEVLANGALYSPKPLASVYMDTPACTNPPIGDCTRGTIKELVGNSLVIIGIYEPAIFVGLDNPTDPSVDAAHDVTQENLLKPALVAIGRSVAGGVPHLRG
jgi:hypothetical protein